MTRSADIRAVNCTSCGAGLDILGGGRVMTHVCPYCGSALDAQDDYRVVAKYANMTRPDTALSIGMTGEVQGVAFSIIGTIQWTETYGGQTWTWVDHQIYSPTHGYAWLTEEDGHFLLTRKYRKTTSPSFLTATGVERSEKRPKVFANGESYSYYDTSQAAITYVEGEFNWSPAIGESSVVVTAVGRDTMLSYEKSSSEREVEMSWYLDPTETLAGFQATAIRKPSRRHPLKPFTGRAAAKFYTVAAGALALISLILACVLSFQPGTTLARADKVSLADLPLEIPFTITDTTKLARIYVDMDVNNSWGFIEMALVDPTDTPVFEVGREVDYYHGRDSEGSWSEGASQTTVKFKPDLAGEYTLELEVTESGTWQRTGSAAQNLWVEISEGHSGGTWLFLLTFLFAVIALLNVLRIVLARGRKFAGSDWVDEDDD